MNRISPKYRRMAEVYKLFATDWSHMLDFSEDALWEMHQYESRGTPIASTNNGYEVGKKWLNVHVAMWRQDIRAGLLFKAELYADKFPHWWLNDVLGSTGPQSPNVQDRLAYILPNVRVGEVHHRTSRESLEEAVSGQDVGRDHESGTAGED